MNRIYLDYAATTPVDPEVLKKTEKLSDPKDDFFGNAGSLHYFGQKAQTLLDSSREKLAKTMTANYREIIFTSSATEANNLVIRGVLKGYFKKQKECRKIPKIIVSSIEHPSVLETIKTLEKEGAIKAIYLSVNPSGVVNIEELKGELDESVILVSVMWVNNETGAVQPIAEIARIISDYKKLLSNTLPFTPYPFFHTDAVQAFNLFDLNVIKSGVDLMTLSSHKIYGSKGAGALFVRSGNEPGEKVADYIEPIITGGGQEYGLRSGTENISAITGFSMAAEISRMTSKKEYARLKELSEYFFKILKSKIPDIEINGDEPGRSPHILNIYFPRHENLGMALDIIGIEASAGSACAQRYEKPSYVLSQMGFEENRVKQSIRFSFGRFTTREEIDEAAGRIITLLNK